MPGLIIAIDGFSSTGKSSFAKLIASRLGILYLDSGAVYRAITLYAVEAGLASGGKVDAAALEEALRSGKVDISFAKSGESGKFEIQLGGVIVEKRIRMMDISDNVSLVAALPAVRNFVDSMLHAYGSDGCVMDGRDIGTAVFPNADLKIFMVADAQTRARRRVLQMEQLGQKVNFEEVLKNVQERDYTDSHRAMNPLRQADDAIVLDNSNMTVEEQMVWLDGILRQKFNISLI